MDLADWGGSPFALHTCRKARPQRRPLAVENRIARLRSNPPSWTPVHRPGLATRPSSAPRGHAHRRKSRSSRWAQSGRRRDQQSRLDRLADSLIAGRRLNRGSTTGVKDNEARSVHRSTLLRPADDSLFDSLAGAVCGTAGRSVAQTRQTGEYVWHALTRPDASWQGGSISSSQGSGFDSLREHHHVVSHSVRTCQW